MKKELLVKVKNLESEIKNLDKQAKKYEEELQLAKAKLETVKNFKESSNSHEKLAYLEAAANLECIKNDLVNLNLMITFKLDDLQIYQNKIKENEENELTM